MLTLRLVPCVHLLALGGADEQTRPFLLAQAIALTTDVEYLAYVAMVQRPVEDRGRDNRIADNLTPVSEASIGRQDD